MPWRLAGSTPVPPRAPYVALPLASAGFPCLFDKSEDFRIERQLRRGLRICHRLIPHRPYPCRDIGIALGEERHLRFPPACEVLRFRRRGIAFAHKLFGFRHQRVPAPRRLFLIESALLQCLDLVFREGFFDQRIENGLDLVMLLFRRHRRFLGELYEIVDGKRVSCRKPRACFLHESERAIDPPVLCGERLFLCFEEPFERHRTLREKLSDFGEREPQTLQRNNLVQSRDLFRAIDTPSRPRAQRRNKTMALVQSKRLLAYAEALRRFGRTKMTLFLGHSTCFRSTAAISGACPRGRVKRNFAAFGKNMNCRGPARRPRVSVCNSFSLQMYEAAAEAPGDGIGAARRAELAEDRLGVEFHRVLGNIEPACNCLVAQALAQPDQDLELARRERGGRLVLVQGREAAIPRHMYAQSGCDRAQRRVDLVG